MGSRGAMDWSSWHTIAYKELSEWVSSIIGQGSGDAAGHLYADGFTHTNALKAVQLEDLLTAGFSTEEAEALLLAVAAATRSDVALEGIMIRQDELTINLRSLADDHRRRVDRIYAKFV